jgi:hypothetical protein
MKIKEEHYDVLKKAISGVLQSHPMADREYHTRGLSAKRYRWDLLHAAKVRICDTRNAFGTEPNAIYFPVYDYLDDTHIDTALRAVVRELQPNGLLNS